ncbi:glycoside hydrolase family 5 protein [Flagelloscypha sp. PMI_526]|nr:glycoside hydrolase family 5 protein [Flagelloscypha sp. PMI_526]
MSSPDSELPVPQVPFADSNRASTVYSDVSNAGSGAQLTEKVAGDDSNVTSSTPPKRNWVKIALIALGVLAAVIVAVVVPIYFKVIKPNSSSGSASTSTGSDSGSNGKPTTVSGAVSGGDGSEITMEDGTKFTYKNSFGGFWVSDPKNPYNSSAQPNSWTPPLSQKWDWSKDRVFGVNIGGWLVIEPFIVPSLFEKYPDALDEWDLSTMMRKDDASGGINQIEDHYKTFITEQDFARIAGAGLNWIRLPVPFWMIETWDGEPFLAKTAWTYCLKAIEWARKYGLRVDLDLHAVPGGQNGYNHGGKMGSLDFLNGPMGYANAQRTLQYIRVITEFFSQPEYQDVVQVFSIINEPMVKKIGEDVMKNFYHEAHDMIRQITGVGKGMYIGLHDGFLGMSNWAGYLAGSDRIVLDSHPYFSFNGGGAGAPIGADGKGGVWPQQACTAWGRSFNTSQKAFGVTIGGEFSAGYNDCGKYLISTAPGTKTNYAGDCSFWEDARKWNATTISGVKEFTLASMDALHHFFFWTWKIGNSSVSGTPSAPLWSYSLGLDMGYMPTDPHESVGKCADFGVSAAFDGAYEPWQTGGGDGKITDGTLQWPPAQISGADGEMATYTATGSIVKLPAPTFSAATTTASDWANAQDTALAPAPVSGCTYPNAWLAAESPGTAFSCNGNAKREPIPEPMAAPTPAPVFRFRRS